jgi:hypothetical protein
MLRMKISKMSKMSLTGSQIDSTRMALNINLKDKSILSCNTLTKSMLWAYLTGCHLLFTRRQREATLISPQAHKRILWRNQTFSQSISRTSSI